MNWVLKNAEVSLSLHGQFKWVDEFEWTALAQTEPVYTLTGAIDIQQGTKKAGRKITLNGDNVFLTRADVQTLQAWSEVPELEMTLIHPDGRQFKVIFRRPALENIHEIKPYRPIDESGTDKFHCDVCFWVV